jgi:hypothetical protein
MAEATYSCKVLCIKLSCLLWGVAGKCNDNSLYEYLNLNFA